MPERFFIITDMRKIILGLLCTLSLLLCSCKINIQQEVKQSNDGYRQKLIITMSEDLINMINADDDGDWVAEIKKSMRDDYGKDAEISEAYNGEDRIISASFVANKKNAKYAPKKMGKDITVPLLDYNEDEYNADAVEGLNTVSSTYTVIIDKNIAPSVQSIKLRRKSGDTVSLKATSNKTAYAISFPTAWAYAQDPVVEIILTTP